MRTAALIGTALVTACTHAGPSRPSGGIDGGGEPGSTERSDSGDSGYAGGPNIPTCSFTKSTEPVASSEVLDLDALLTYLDAIRETSATWWDGDTTGLVIDIDTEAAIASVDQTTYEFDPATSSANATADYCGTFHYWSFSLALVAAGTTDGAVSATDGAVDLVCADNVINRPPPEEGLPDGWCGLRVGFDIAVSVDAARVPLGHTGPFVAHVSVAAEDAGAINASVVGAGDGVEPILATANP